METVRYYANFINPHWIAVVATGLYTHIRQICVIGLCSMQEKPAFEAYSPYASLLFVFSVLCLLAEYRLWPITLKEPPIQLLYIYEMLIAALSTNLAIHMVWIPMMDSIYCLTQLSSEWLNQLNDSMGLDSYSWLNTFADYMDTNTAPMYMAYCVSLLSFAWMLDATESLDTFLDTWSKHAQVANIITRRHRKRKRKKIRFSNPEVTHSFFYKLCRMKPFVTNCRM
ncbi:uncharacterized protein LOC109851787 isoform X2 [Pseudomyrmex gracilis]|uniref:uncharacterized protein LOC109851787 isoform X2 n=1 Tax=Pseudomyrmex gracilis TaxID=219809 RepID=UPI000994E65A|nr:uncharacterized protein LOC109851787 isoform X2 [Pseudomyrmex gracilis]